MSLDKTGISTVLLMSQLPSYHLRLARDTDVDAIHELFCEPTVYEFLADGAAPPRDISEQWVARSDELSRRYGGGLWLLQRDEGLAPAGLVQLAEFAQRRLELTYVLRPSAWGAGLATRMAHTAIGRCFSRGRIDAIWGGADMPNVRSIRVMERLGMRFLRHVEYPAGPGVEYELSNTTYSSATHAPLRVISSNEQGETE
ncbi:MAG: GNAT family N-acetyltransferase [Pseudomonadota bacterium]